MNKRLKKKPENDMKELLQRLVDDNQQLTEEISKLKVELQKIQTDIAVYKVINHDGAQMSDKVDELNSLIDQLEAEVKKLVEINKNMVAKNANMRDEIDSLWLMMDEMTKSDIENWSSILEELKENVVVSAMMVTKKKAKC